VGIWQQFVKARDELTSNCRNRHSRSDDAYAWKQKGQALAALFPDRLGPAFAERFDPKRSAKPNSGSGRGRNSCSAFWLRTRPACCHPDREVLFPHDE
jgi:hypothetical protein